MNTCNIPVKTEIKEIQKVVKRLSFEQAFQKVLDESQLQEIVDGKRELNQWGIALKNDLEAANKFLNTFCQDLSILTKRKHRVFELSGPFSIDISKIVTSSDNWNDRIVKIWDTFKWAFTERVKNCTGNLWLHRDTLSVDPRPRLIPITKIVIENNSCSFSWMDNLSTVTKRVVADVALICPDDFPKNIPDDVKETLSLLKTTTFDYSPKIMDGILVNEEQELRLKQDPALILNIGKFGLLMVEYWNEPWTEKSRDWLELWSTKAGVFMAILFTLLLSLSWIPSLGDSIILNIVYIVLRVLAGFFLLVTFGGFMELIEKISIVKIKI